ncbi:hypothetical protein D4S03_04355 [bacterium]|nr:MAG: hypothetical protein D4S03_04355 [bacterium]
MRYQQDTTGFYPSIEAERAKVEQKIAERDPNWNQSNDPRPKVMYPSMASAEEKEKIRQINEAKLKKRVEMFDAGQLGVGSIMYETMDDLVCAEKVEKALAEDEKKKIADDYYNNDLLYQSMNHSLTVDENSKIVERK